MFNIFEQHKSRIKIHQNSSLVTAKTICSIGPRRRRRCGVPKLEEILELSAFYLT